MTSDRSVTVAVVVAVAVAVAVIVAVVVTDGRTVAVAVVVVGGRGAASGQVEGEGRARDGPGLDLLAGQGRRHDDDERADVTADVQHHRALAGVRVVLHRRQDAWSATPVPGVLW
jgi:hypothetical protein